jgi:DhnA family fructose-bisphosphate aldolase class Ia
MIETIALGGSVSGIDLRIAKLFHGKKSLVISALDHVMEYGEQPGIEDAATAIRNCMGTDALLMSRFMLRRNPTLMGGEHAPLKAHGLS